MNTGTPPVSMARAVLAARLTQLRVAAKLTGRDLATTLGWHASKVSRLENADKVPQESELRAWCMAVDAPSTQLVDLIAAARNIGADETTRPVADPPDTAQLTRIESSLAAGTLPAERLPAALAAAGMPRLARAIIELKASD